MKANGEDGCRNRGPEAAADGQAAPGAGGAGGVTVVDRFSPRWRKTFRSSRAARRWVLEGLVGTDGAERDHYVRMLLELEEGATTLHYN